MPKALEKVPDSKVCAKCKIEKPRSDFRTSGKRNPNSLYSYCKECCRAKGREYYENNRPHWIAKSRKKADANRAFFRNLKDGKPCADCGVRYPYYVLDWDHRDPAQKRISCSNVGRRGRKLLLQEIAKCDLICANCHRVRTHNQRQANLIRNNPKRYYDGCAPYGTTKRAS